MQIPFIKFSKVWFTISGLLVVLSIAAVSMWGLKLGIDFTGGSLVELHFTGERPAVEQMQTTLQELNLSNSVIQMSGDESVIIRTSFLSEEQHQQFLQAFREDFQTENTSFNELRFETISSSVSNQLRSRALWAIIWVNVAIVAYVAYAFRGVSKPVASWKYGALAIVALIHDIMIVIGVFAVLGRFAGIEVGIDFVLALLTVLGFSVTDTIVVFDRVRENVVNKTADTFAGTVNLALNETVMRSINTTLTTLLPLFALYFFGGETIKYFALALLVGMASGTYSSVFTASPLLVYVEKWQKRNEA